MDAKEVGKSTVVHELSEFRVTVTTSFSTEPGYRHLFRVFTIIVASHRPSAD